VPRATGYRHLLPVILAVALFHHAPHALAQVARAVPVTVAAAREEAIQQVVRLTGTVTSSRDASLSPATSGLVTALHVDAGSQVVAGDVLLELDQELAHWQWRSAAAAADAAGVALEDAQRRLEEARSLAPQRSIAETVVRDLAAEVAQDEAALQQAQADAEFRRALLDRHQLRAPFSGVIGARRTDLGEWVTPGTAVFTLVGTEELRIDFPVAEDYLATVRAGAEVNYTLGKNRTDTRRARVATVVPVSDPEARTVLLRVYPREADARMIPGMAAHGTLRVATGRRSLVVPRDALIRYSDGRVVVWVVQESPEGTLVSERPVETGLAFDGLVEVRRGLAPGARVVVEGNEALQVDQRVDVLE